MAILIDELMKDREMLGYYIITLYIGQDDEKLTNEKVGDLYDSIFGEQEDREIEEVMEKYKKQTEFAQGLINLLKRHSETLGEASKES